MTSTHALYEVVDGRREVTHSESVLSWLCILSLASHTLSLVKERWQSTYFPGFRFFNGLLVPSELFSEETPAWVRWVDVGRRVPLCAEDSLNQSDRSGPL